MTLNNDKLLGFQLDITVIPSSAGGICRYTERLMNDVDGVLVLHRNGKTSTIVKPITVRNLNLYRTT